VLTVLIALKHLGTNKPTYLTAHKILADKI